MSLRHPPQLKPDPELPGVFTGGWAAPREGPGPVGPQHPNNHPSPKKEPWVGPFGAHLLGETEAGRRGSPNPHDRAAQDTAHFRVTQTDTLLLITSQLPMHQTEAFPSKSRPRSSQYPQERLGFPPFSPRPLYLPPIGTQAGEGQSLHEITASLYAHTPVAGGYIHYICTCMPPTWHVYPLAMYIHL